MKTLLLSALLFALATVQSAGAGSAFKHFVTVKGDQLVEGKKPFRFLSFDIPNLHLVEDNVAFEASSAWRWPDRFEIRDALESLREQGGTVTRCYVLSVVRPDDAPGLPRHVLGPGRFNEEGFRALDQVLDVANRTGVRLIIPFVDNWNWWGGIAEYARFRGKPKEAFWTDPEVIADFKQTIRFLVTRTNTVTGVPYRDDKAILCWETGNEIQSPAAWTRAIAAFIKSLDRNHPVMDGFNATELREESLAMPEVDLVTTHHYPGGRKSFADLIHENWQKAKGRKPYVVGEFGFVETPAMIAAMQAVRDTGAAGGLLWSLRFRNRDGGFYWHYEPAGGNKYKAFHWPGFSTGAEYDEIELLSRLREQAFAIRGLPLPKPHVPAAPRVLPINDAAAISWQGAVGATSYQVERAPAKNGPWRVAGANVDETAVQYRPLFADTAAGPGKWFYRVRSRNGAGTSAPSAPVGPVTVTHGTLVDEFADFSHIQSHSGTLSFETHDCRKALEDATRLAGSPGSAIVYQLPGPIAQVRLYAFFTGKPADFAFAVSADGAQYTALPVGEKHVRGGGGSDYGYWAPAYYLVRPAGPAARRLRIEFGAEAQLSRIEIQYGFAP